MENQTLAMEMLKELKANNERKDRIIVALILVILTMIIGFFIYENQFEEITEQTTVDAGEDGIATYLEDSESGDINYGKDN